MATLRTPFHSLSADNLISRGAAGHVFTISETIVFKCPTTFDNPAPSQEQEMEESIKQIEKEKIVYKTLMQHPHPHIVHAILCVPEGFFMQRLQTTLDIRLQHHTPNPETQERWIQELVSATVWLEDLGYVHGDLRPGNILLDHMDNIKISDFDATVKKGEELLVATEPFCKLDRDFETFSAGSLTEQFSLGSCIYNIRYGYPPFHDVDPPVRVRKMINGEYPSTSSDARFGDIISACWQGAYDSIHDLELEIQQLGNGYDGAMTSSGLAGVGYLESWCLLAECKGYLIKERFRLGGGLLTYRARFRYWGRCALYKVLSFCLRVRGY